MIDFLLALFFSIIVTLIYLHYAEKNKIFALVNERSLHKIPVITGAGIILGLCFFYLFLLHIYQTEFVSKNNFIVVVFLFSFVLSIFGLYDDKFDIAAIKKLLFQIFVTTIFSSLYVINLIPNENLLIQLILILSIMFLLVVSINCFNFMDGINGLALSLALYILFSMIILNENIEIREEIIILIATLFILIIFNIKNKLFIGDAGSISLGFFIGVILLNEMLVKNISFITVAILIAYWVSDTVCTFFVRLIIFKNWYSPHKSHPYQQLTRLLNSQTKVLIIINVINIAYLFPLAYLSQTFPYLNAFFLFMAYTPTIIFSLKYRPKLTK